MILIAAVDENGGIGRNGDQLCYLREDLKRFRALTLGKTVILGRRTLAALPGGAPLRGREHFVLSADPDFAPEGVTVFRDLPSLLARAPEDSVVIGGGSVYRQLLPYCDTAFLTRIHAAFPADTFFPDPEADPAWVLTEESAPLEQDGIVYHYATYVRRAL